MMANIERSHRHKRHSSRRAKAFDPAKNKWYQMMVGVVLGAGNTLDDNAVGDLNQCLPVEWGVAVDDGKLAIDAAKSATDGAVGAAKQAEEAITASQVEPLKAFAQKILLATKSATAAAKIIADAANTAALKLGSPVAKPVDKEDPKEAHNPKVDESGAKKKLEEAGDHKTFHKVLDIIQSVLNFLCKWKDKVKALFTRRYKKYMLRKKFYKFKEASVKNRRNKYLMSSKHFWEDATGFFERFEDWEHKDWEEIKDMGHWVYEKVESEIKEGIKWVQNFIKSPLVKKITDIVQCAIKNKGVAISFINTVKGLIARITLIATTGPIGIADVFIDLLCNIGKFRTAFATLDNAKKEKDDLIQWRKYGMFIGDMFYALGN